MSVSCECCVLSGRGLCDGLITLPEESCGVSECECKASIMRKSWPSGRGGGRVGHENKKKKCTELVG